MNLHLISSMLVICLDKSYLTESGVSMRQDIFTLFGTHLPLPKWIFCICPFHYFESPLSECAWFLSSCGTNLFIMM